MVAAVYGHVGRDFPSPSAENLAVLVAVPSYSPHPVDNIITDSSHRCVFGEFHSRKHKHSGVAMLAKGSADWHRGITFDTIKAHPSLE
eukprot:4233037-Pyramimonas_sp.AAC.1